MQRTRTCGGTKGNRLGNHSPTAERPLRVVACRYDLIEKTTVEFTAEAMASTPWTDENLDGRFNPGDDDGCATLASHRTARHAAASTLAAVRLLRLTTHHGMPRGFSLLAALFLPAVARPSTH